MRDELAKLFEPAGLRVQWVTPGVPTTADRTVSVELRGSCEPSAGRPAKFKNRTPLASTVVQDGKVLPFSWIDCDSLDRFLGNSLASVGQPERAATYGRAMARLLAHEFFHVIAGTESHTPAGVSKTAFTVADLLTDQLAFPPVALAMLHVEPAEPVEVAQGGLDPEYGAELDGPADSTYDEALIGR